MRERRHTGAHARYLVARAAARDFGALSIDELRGCGLSYEAIRARERNGELHRLHHGVFAVGHTNLPLEGRFLAAVKACGPTAVLSHVAALALYGCFEWDHRRVEVTVAGEGTRGHAEIHTHRTALLEPIDMRRVKGIPVTSPARALLDCAACLSDHELRRAVREAQARKLVTIAELVEVLARLAGRRGSRSLARVVATGPAPTRSVLEDAVLDLMLRGGLAHPDVNVPLDLDGRRVVPDFRWPEQRLVVEADGAAWHDHKLGREDDAERQALLEAHGETVIRVTWNQAIGRPAQTLTRVERAGAPRATRNRA